MHETPDLSLIVTVFAALLGMGWGYLIDPARHSTHWIAVACASATGFLMSYLVPDAVLAVPVLVLTLASVTALRDKRWRASLIRTECPPRTPPPLPPSASGSE